MWPTFDPITEDFVVTLSVFVFKLVAWSSIVINDIELKAFSPPEGCVSRVISLILSLSVVQTCIERKNNVL